MKNFELGKVFITVAVLDHMCIEDGFEFFVADSLKRYKNCDWGDTCKEDKDMNDEAIINGDRIFAAYIFSANNEKIWIITEADRSLTTIMFPEEY